MINETKETPIYETNNVDLASFLILEGIKLLELKKSDSNSRVILIRFLDERQTCLDLERVFLNSQCKRFRDINKWLLQKIHEKLRSE